jgi:ABC-type glycerol-3-phosphate transport system substrate-binding protein
VSVPPLRQASAGPSYSGAASIPISRFFVATPSTSIFAINAALLLGKNLILTPGIYNLDAPIVVERPDTIVLGLGFTTLIPKGADSPVTTGGEGLAWAVTTGSKHPDVAAAYIDFINNADAAKTFIDENSLPSVIPADYTPKPGLETDVFDTYGKVTSSGGLVPYLDYSTPTFYDTLTSAVQQLTDKQVTPEAFTEILQKDYSGFVGSK